MLVLLFTAIFFWYLNIIGPKHFKINSPSLTGQRLLSWGLEQHPAGLVARPQWDKPSSRFQHAWGHRHLHFIRTFYCNRSILLETASVRHGSYPFLLLLEKHILAWSSRTESHALWFTEWKPAIMCQWHLLLWQLKQQNAICQTLGCSPATQADTRRGNKEAGPHSRGWVAAGT